MIKNKSARILKASLTCFVEQGFHTTTTEQVAERAGIGVGTLFRDYRTKEKLSEAVDNHVKTLLTSHLKSPEAATRPGEPLKVWVNRYWILAAQVAITQSLAFTYWNRQRIAPRLESSNNEFFSLGSLIDIPNVLQRQVNAQHVSPLGEVLPLPRPLPLISTLLVTQWVAAVESVLSFPTCQTDATLTASILQHAFESCWAGLQLPAHIIAEPLSPQRVLVRPKLSRPVFELSKPMSALTSTEKLVVGLVKVLADAAVLEMKRRNIGSTMAGTTSLRNAS